MNQDGNIMAALPISSTLDYKSFNQSIVAALVLSWICFATEFIGLFSGRTMFSAVSNTINICAHATGTIALCLFITEGWHYLSYWYIFVFCSLAPWTIEMAVLVLQIQSQI
ncbi:hypothetical protein RTP6_001734 [Batrachochytrium dendrobatidis]